MKVYDCRVDHGLQSVQSYFNYLSICHYEMLSLREILPFSLVKSELLELQELKFRLRTEFKLHTRL
jgi:hypothetical protein